MALTVSAPVRIAAICGLVATVVIFGGLRLLGGSGGSDSVAAPHVIKHHPFGPGAAKKTAVTPRKATPAATHKTATKPKHVTAKPKAKPKPTIDFAAIKAARAAGLPEPIALAFGRAKTVVVSLYDPYSQVDGTSFAEARAGAALAGVGFVPLSVLSQRDVGKLTQQLGLLPDPGVLVYVRPGNLAVKIAGFADKETVAQAAQNAARGT
jgi:uncharacterized iron-regulated membrane protein